MDAGKQCQGSLYLPLLLVDDILLLFDESGHAEVSRAIASHISSSPAFKTTSRSINVKNIAALRVDDDNRLQTLLSELDRYLHDEEDGDTVHKAVSIQLSQVGTDRHHGLIHSLSYTWDIICSLECLFVSDNRSPQGSL